MRFLAFKKSCFIVVFSMFSSQFIFSQEGTITIDQDPKISQLLTFKKEINQETGNDNRYKIQIFNGNYDNAKKIEARFKSKHPDIASTIKFETPNYKVWVGNFRTSLEADRYLVTLKNSFPKAFKFIPPKKKKKKRA